jgi:hypothetical protein
MPVLLAWSGVDGVAGWDSNDAAVCRARRCCLPVACVPWWLSGYSSVIFLSWVIAVIAFGQPA